MPRYGFIHTKEDIKFLILYSLGFFEHAISFDEIVDLCTASDSGFGWFELKEAFDELLVSEHILQDSDGFLVTAKGTDTAKLFENRLPFSVREAVRAAVVRLHDTMRRDAVISTQITHTASGDYAVNMALEDVFSLQLFANDQAQANKLANIFRKDAEQICAQVLALFETEHP